MRRLDIFLSFGSWRILKYMLSLSLHKKTFKYPISMSNKPSDLLVCQDNLIWKDDKSLMIVKLEEN